MMYPNVVNIQTIVTVWRNGNALVVINEFTLRRARLVLGRVTVWRMNHLGI